MSNKNKQNIGSDDLAIFDNTLKQIEKMLEKLGEKIEPEQKLIFDKNIQDKNTNKNTEHIIDNTHLKMEELHNFNSKTSEISKNSFGFYTYLALIIGFIFLVYEILNITKDLIISKFPVSEPYIDYLYEIIEIFAYLVMNIVSFLRNLF